MSRSSLIKDHIITDGDMSQASITSPAININFSDNVGLQLIFTGSPVGTFSAQVSIDHTQDSQGNVIVAGNWVDLDFGTTPAASGSADDIYLDMNQLSAPWIRVKYTKTSGTGTLNAYIAYKVL